MSPNCSAHISSSPLFPHIFGFLQRASAISNLHFSLSRNVVGHLEVFWLYLLTVHNQSVFWNATVHSLITKWSSYLMRPHGPSSPSQIFEGHLAARLRIFYQRDSYCIEHSTSDLAVETTAFARHTFSVFRQLQPNRLNRLQRLGLIVKNG